MTDDVLLTMPPEPLEYEGPVTVAAFLRDRHGARGGRRMRLVATRANGQPAFGHYVEDPHAPVLRFAGIIVLTLRGDAISGVTRFADTGVVRQFGLPRTLRL